MASSDGSPEGAEPRECGNLFCFLHRSGRARPAQNAQTVELQRCAACHPTASATAAARPLGLSAADDPPAMAASVEPPVSLTLANRLLREGQHDRAAAMYRRLLQQQHPMRWHLERNLAFCQLRGGDATGLDALDAMAAPVDTVAALAAGEPEPVVVCLTSIHSRLARLPRVIQSLHEQDHPPTEIRLHLSREPYLLDQGVAPDDPALAALQAFPLLRLHWVPNTGPFRKILPFMAEHIASGASAERRFITVDDDTIYPPTFIATLLAEHRRHDCIVAFRGRQIVLDGARVASYTRWGLGAAVPSLLNLPTGKDGILYSTRHFTPDFVDTASALRLCPTADDLWIKWHAALNGVPSLILNPEACTSDYRSFPVVDYAAEVRNNSLYAQYNAQGAEGKNDAAVQALEAYFQQRHGYNLAALLIEEAA